MTPAKMLALLDKRLEDMELREMPIARMAWMYRNSHRDPGNSDPKAGVIRPAEDALNISHFRTHYRPGRMKSLVNKESEFPVGGEHNWRGAKADKSAFDSWRKARKRKTARPKKG